MDKIFCAVCKMENINEVPTKCELCEFPNNSVLSGYFLTLKDANLWFETVVKPYRLELVAKKQEADHLINLEEKNNKIDELQTQLDKLKKKEISHLLWWLKQWEARKWNDELVRVQMKSYRIKLETSRREAELLSQIEGMCEKEKNLKSLF